MDSKRLQTAKAYIGHFTTLDPVLLASLLADNYTHIMAPASLSIDPLTKESFLEHNTNLRRIMSSFPVYGKEYIESEAANTVVVWATSRTGFKDEVRREGEDDWEYEGEYVFMLEMDATGEKVVRCVEFLDSLKTQNGLRPLAKRAKERVAGGALEKGGVM